MDLDEFRKLKAGLDFSREEREHEIQVDIEIQDSKCSWQGNGGRLCLRRRICEEWVIVERYYMPADAGR